MTWFYSGKEAENELQREEKVKEALYNKPQRFWLKQGDDIKVTFLDSKDNRKYPFPFMYKEHTVKVGAKWESFTCIQGVPHSKTGKPQRCPLCESGNKYVLVSAFTVIDHSEYQGKKKLYKDEIKLYIAKPTTHKILAKYFAKKGDLRGWLVEVSREGDQSPGVGNCFDFEERLTDDKFKELTDSKYDKLPEALDYAEACAPLDEEVMKQRLLGLQQTAEVIPYGISVDPTTGDHNEDVDDDDIPF